jgi:hypothetical protein
MSFSVGVSVRPRLVCLRLEASNQGRIGKKCKVESASAAQQRQQGKE